MTRININDLAPELAMMICNKFKIERSVKIITSNTVSIPIEIEFNTKLDELIVIKNSTVLNSSQYAIDKLGTQITPTDSKVWEASKRFPVEFNFIVLKAAMPNVSASLWRGKYTLTANAKSVPITVRGFNKNSDELIVIKNGVVVAHDEYDIVEDSLVAATEEGIWKASKRAPVNFEYVVFKFATPSNSMALNGYHLMENSVTPEALHPEIRAMLDMMKIYVNKVDFLYDAIQKYGNFELKNYISENIDNTESEILKQIDESNNSKIKLFTEYNQIDELAKSRHRDIVQRLEKLGLIEDLDKMFPEDPESTEDRNDV